MTGDARNLHLRLAVIRQVLPAHEGGMDAPLCLPFGLGQCSTPEEVVLVNLLCWAGAVGQRERAN